MIYALNKCPRRESNPHAQKDTWPSTMPVYQFQHLGVSLEMNVNKKIEHIASTFIAFRDLAGARTQDPLLKREMLYQLSYQVFLLLKPAFR